METLTLKLPQEIRFSYNRKIHPDLDSVRIAFSNYCRQTEEVNVNESEKINYKNFVLISTDRDRIGLMVNYAPTNSKFIVPGELFGFSNLSYLAISEINAEDNSLKIIGWTTKEKIEHNCEYEHNTHSYYLEYEQLDKLVSSLFLSRNMLYCYP